MESCCIIDDDEFFALQSKKVIEGLDLFTTILLYTDGQNALDGLIGLIVENIPLPKIIFLDLNMPKRDGWSFLKEFEQLPTEKIEHIHVYIVSALITPDLIEKSKNFRLVKDYIEKPFTHETVRRIIKGI